MSLRESRILAPTARFMRWRNPRNRVILALSFSSIVLISVLWSLSHATILYALFLSSPLPEVNESMEAASSAESAASSIVSSHVDSQAPLLFDGDSLAPDTAPPLQPLCLPDQLHAVASALRPSHLQYHPGSPAALSARLIPHAIHQTAPDNLTAPTCETWHALHPDFEHIVWSDASARAMLQQCLPGLLPVWDAVPLGILRSDLLRYAVLFLWGGVWSDADTFPLKPFEWWLGRVAGGATSANTGLIVAMEVDVDWPDWRQHFPRNPQLCQWTIAARPRHPVVEKALRVALRRVARLTESLVSTEPGGGLRLQRQPTGVEIMDAAGPGTWTDVLALGLQVYGNRSLEDFRRLQHGVLAGGDIVVLPVTAFMPGVSHSGSQAVGHPEARVKHLFTKTWVAHIKKQST